jgi:hypothetical protein
MALGHEKPPRMYVVKIGKIVQEILRKSP